MERLEFTTRTMKEALTRQKHRCASCGEPIRFLGRAGRQYHRFGEMVHAHHMVHAKAGGDNSKGNCVIICQACHYNAHEGGNYKGGTVQGRPQDFPHYRG